MGCLTWILAADRYLSNPCYCVALLDDVSCNIEFNTSALAVSPFRSFFACVSSVLMLSGHMVFLEEMSS